MLTDVPIGSWTVAGVCDALELVTGRKEFDTGADVAIAVGLVGATGAVVTGLADWQYLVDRPRRVGLVHGLLNVGAVTLYAVSFGLRRSGAPGAGRGIAAVAYGLVTVSGYFGVEFVFNIKDLAQVKIQGGVAEITEKGDTTMVSFSKDYRP